MIFLSTHAAFRHEEEKSNYEIHRIAGSEGSEKVPVYGLAAQFSPVKGNGVVLHDKTWRGMLDTKEQVSRLQELNPDLTETEFVSILLNHKNFGTDFIAFGEGGTEAVPDEGLVSDMGDAGYWCEPCSKMIKTAQGLNGHFGSGGHQEARAEYITNLRRKHRM
jgi:hypothetical protein